ncbi:MAG TPA: hypothetical protein VFT24_07550 [Vicinamibacterales bacterium]|nr:hypothetical protein [Vicinamibacterales bacterium]
MLIDTVSRGAAPLTVAIEPGSHGWVSYIRLGLVAMKRRPYRAVGAGISSLLKRGSISSRIAT